MKEAQISEANETESILWRLKQLGGLGVRELIDAQGGISSDEAGEVLHAALTLDDALFRDILAACPPGEYAAGDAQIDKAADAAFQLYGTIPVLAAARGETEKLKMLRGHGMDMNAASEAVCAALEPNGCFCEEQFQAQSTLLQEGTLQHMRGGCRNSTAYDWNHAPILGTTPLAAAVLFGRTDCVRWLLSLPEVTASDSSALAAAALLSAHGKQQRRRCACLALGLPEASRCVPKKLCERALIPLETAVEYGTAEDLRARLACPDVTEAAAQALLDGHSYWLLDPDYPKFWNFRRAEAFLALLDAFPALAEDERTKDILLRMGLRAEMLLRSIGPKMTAFLEEGTPEHLRESWWRDTLLRRWREVSGPERDISAGFSLLLCRIGSLEELENLMDRLAEGGGTLTAASETAEVGLHFPFAEKLMTMLLRRVRFYRCTDKGISALADSILGLGSLRLLRDALRRGALAGENRAALLERVMEFRLSAPARAAVLMGAGAPVPPRPLRFGVRYRYRLGMESVVTERDNNETEEMQ